jgi:hypothetical protein
MNKGKGLNQKKTMTLKKIHTKATIEIGNH